MMTRQVCTAAADLIQDFETLRLVAFKPTPDDVWTIGWGHTEGVKEGDIWTKPYADQVFEQDIADRAQWAYDAIDEDVRDDLTDNQFGAIVSFVYNLGIEAFKESTLLKKVNAQDYAGASAEFLKWIYQHGKVLNGLVRRRATERALFDRP